MGNKKYSGVHQFPSRRRLSKKKGWKKRRQMLKELMNCHEEVNTVCDTENKYIDCREYEQSQNDNLKIGLINTLEQTNSLNHEHNTHVQDFNFTFGHSTPTDCHECDPGDSMYFEVKEEIKQEVNVELKEDEECLDDRLDVFDQNSSNKYIKNSDELLIDMVGSRPYLYDETVENYKNTKMKENTWTEIAIALNITFTECKNQWIRLRQRFNEEKQLRENETKDGAEKSTRQKWMLFENLAFLERHVAEKKSFSNVNFAKPSELNGVTGTLLRTQRSMVLQDGCEMFANDDSNPSTSSSFSHQSPTLKTKESNIVSPPFSCFLRDHQRALKTHQIDPVETTSHELKNTLCVGTEVCSQKTPVKDNDTDVIIGKLVTVVLQRTAEPHKSELKRKIMNLLYFSKKP